MCSQVSKKSTLKTEILRYRPAVFNKKAKEKYVYFSVIDPQSVIDGHPKLKRFRYKFNDYPSAKERDAAAARFVAEVNRKLEDGWNPLIESSTKKTWTLTADVITSYEHYLKKLLKDGVFKPKTYTDYTSRLKILKEYIESHAIPYIYMLDKLYIEGFLEYIYIDRDASPRTRNNYLGFMSSMYTWIVDSGYATTNACSSIKSLRNKEKFRKALSNDDINKLFEHLMENDKWFLLACKFHYYTLVRPNEMSHVRVGDISVKSQTVFIPADVSKNRKDGVVTLPKNLIEMMIEMNIFSNPSTYYVFSEKFKPGAKMCHPRKFTEKWDAVREELHFPKTYQFYSLKDTGITAIINNVGLNVAKDQARHSSVAVTNAYASKEQMRAHPELLNFE